MGDVRSLHRRAPSPARTALLAAVTACGLTGCSRGSDQPEFDRYGRPLSAAGDPVEVDASVSLTESAQGDRFGAGAPSGNTQIIAPRRIVDEPTAEAATDPAIEQVELAAKRRRKGDLAGAIAAMKKAWALDKSDPDIAVALGQMYQENDQLRFAEAAYRDAIAVEPKNTDARYGLGVVLLKRGMTDSAREVLEALAKERPEDQRLLDALAAVRSKTGDTRAAIAALQKKAAETPGDTAVNTQLGNALATEGRYDEAAKALDEAAKSKPDDPTVQLQLGAALAESGDLKGAESALQKSAELAPKDVRAWRTLAAVRENLGDAEGAAQAYEKMLQNVEGADPDGAVTERIQKLRTAGLQKQEGAQAGTAGGGANR